MNEGKVNFDVGLLTVQGSTDPDDYFGRI